MAIELAGTTIERVRVVDDDPSFRETLALALEDTNLTPLQAEDSLPVLEEFVSQSMREADAVICDYKLTKGTYSSFNGASAVSGFYIRRFPALLCTAYAKAEMVNLRLYRRNIPAVLEADNINPERIRQGFTICINEFNGVFDQSRRPWKTLVRVEDLIGEVQPRTFDIVLPGWNSKEVIRLPLDIIPKERQNQIVPGFRFYSFVNKGATTQQDLYFSDFIFE